MTRMDGKIGQPIEGKGFTLLELLAAMIILAIVANFGISSFMLMGERERMRKAQSKLTMICYAERIYRKDWAAYANRGQLIIDYCPEPDSSEYTYTISLSSPPPDDYFIATATRVWGPYQSSTVSVSSVAHTDPDCSTYTFGGNYDSTGNPRKL